MLREFANEVILDVLFYMEADHRARIQATVLRRIEALLAAWRTHNPRFDTSGGHVVLVGHSLGALIGYDLVVSGALSPKLQRPLKGFVALGSPVACFLALRGHNLGRSFTFPDCRRFFNIFDPNDAVAYRIEPLLLEDDLTLVASSTATPDDGGAEGANGATVDADDEIVVAEILAASISGGKVDEIEAAQGASDAVQARRELCDHASQTKLLPPAPVPSAGASTARWVQLRLRKAVAGGVTDVAKGVASWLGGWGASPQELGEMASPAEDEGPSWALNDGERVDWVLQPSTVELAGSTSEYFAALKAHSTYWLTADVPYFIVHEVLGAGLGARD